jgi:hypothetical protein
MKKRCNNAKCEDCGGFCCHLLVTFLTLYVLAPCAEHRLHHRLTEFSNSHTKIWTKNYDHLSQGKSYVLKEDVKFTNLIPNCKYNNFTKLTAL